MFLIVDSTDEFPGGLTNFQDYPKKVGPCGLHTKPSKTIILEPCPKNNHSEYCIVRTLVGSVGQGRLSVSSAIAKMGALPLADNSVDLVICAGNLLNRCDIGVAILEVGRVVAPRGYLSVEFDSSLSLELLGQKAFGRSVGFLTRKYNDSYARYSVYSRRYIKNLLRALQFQEVRATAIQELKCRDQWLRSRSAFAALIRRLSLIRRALPFSNRWAQRQLVVCQKSI
jgi:hypothetical protein